jgi:hypothetical protein
MLAKVLDQKRKSLLVDAMSVIGTLRHSAMHHFVVCWMHSGQTWVSALTS